VNTSRLSLHLQTAYAKFQSTIAGKHLEYPTTRNNRDFRNGGFYFQISSSLSSIWSSLISILFGQYNFEMFSSEPTLSTEKGVSWTKGFFPLRAKLEKIWKLVRAFDLPPITMITTRRAFDLPPTTTSDDLSLRCRLPVGAWAYNQLQVTIAATIEVAEVSSV